MPSAGRHPRTKPFVSKTAAPKPRRPVPSKPEAVKEPGLITAESEPDPAVQEPKLRSDRKYGIVYRRKRRKIPAVEARMKIPEAVRNLAEQSAGISAGDICTGLEVPVALTVLLEPYRSDGCVRFSTVLISILSWMRRSVSGVRGLTRILFSGSLAAVFSLHCIHFLPIRRQVALSRNALPCCGLCNIYTSGLIVPLISVNFPVLPVYFRNLHVAIALCSLYLPGVLARYLVDVSQSEEILSLSHVEILISRNYSIATEVPAVESSKKLNTTEGPVFLQNMVIAHSLMKKHCKKKRNVRLRGDCDRSSLVSLPVNPPSRHKLLIPPHVRPLRACRVKLLREKGNASSPLVKHRKEKVSAVGNRKLANLFKRIMRHSKKKRTMRHRGDREDFKVPFSVEQLGDCHGYLLRETGDASFPCRPLRSTQFLDTIEMKVALAEVKQNIDSARCDVNILVMEPDKCWREKGAELMLKLWDSKEWCLAVKVQGITRYLHKPQDWRPCVVNRLNHNYIWGWEDGWKLEFIDKWDFSVFKEMHTKCLERNLPDVSLKGFPISAVRRVPDYDDIRPTSFMRPEMYIHMTGNEIERALASGIVIYDMDSRDEEWLKQSMDNCLGHISEDDFEKIIFALEKNAYNNSDNAPDKERAVDLCQDFGSRDMVATVYDYWLRKREKRRDALQEMEIRRSLFDENENTGPALVRVFQGQPLWSAKSPQKPSSRKKSSRRGGRRKLDVDAQGLVDMKEGVKKASQVPALLKTNSVQKPTPRKLRSSSRQQRQGGSCKLDVDTQGPVDNKYRVEEANPGPPLRKTEPIQQPSPRTSSRQQRWGERGKTDIYRQRLVDNKDGVKEASHVRPLWETETIQKLSPRKTRSSSIQERQVERGKLHVYMQGLADNKDRVEEASHVRPSWKTETIQKLSPRKTRSSSRQERQGGRGKLGVYIQRLVDNKDGVEEARQVPPSWKTETIQKLSPRKTRSSNKQERQGGRGKLHVYLQGLVDNKDGVEEASQVRPLWKSEPIQKLSPRETRSSSRQERHGGRGKLDVCMQDLVNNKDGVEEASQVRPTWKLEPIQNLSPQKTRSSSRQERQGGRGKLDVYMQCLVDNKDRVEESNQVQLPRKTEMMKKLSPRKIRLSSRQEIQGGRGKMNHKDSVEEASQLSPLLKSESIQISSPQKQGRGKSMYVLGMLEATRQFEDAEYAAKRAAEFAIDMRRRAQESMANVDLSVYKSVTALQIAEAKRVSEI